MRLEAFRLHMSLTLGAGSVTSYISWCRGIEAEIGTDLDQADLSELSLSALGRRLRDRGLAPKTISNTLSAARRYRSFRETASGALAAIESKPMARPHPIRRIAQEPLPPSADEVLLSATVAQGVNLVELVARCSIWAHPDVVEELRRTEPDACWFPAKRRMKSGERRGDVVEGVRLDDNTWANLAAKLATYGHRKLKGFHVCHVWPASCYDPRCHTSIANLVLVPAPLAGLTDYDAGVGAALRYRAFELFSWHPPSEAPPPRPDRYPAGDAWRAPPEVSPGVWRVLQRRLAKR